MVRINSRNHVIENKPQTWTARQLKHHKDYQLQNQPTEKQQLLSTRKLTKNHIHFTGMQYWMQFGSCNTVYLENVYDFGSVFCS